ncbi:hypothetical protein GCM10020227_21750 [Streptomyces flavovirens]
MTSCGDNSGNARPSSTSKGTGANSFTTGSILYVDGGTDAAMRTGPSPRPCGGDRRAVTYVREGPVGGPGRIRVCGPVPGRSAP